jgi:PAS domain S-box-containing protein
VIKRWRDWPWSGKLAVLIVAIALLPIAIGTIYTEVEARAHFVRDSGARNLQQAISTAELIAKQLDDAVGDVTVLAQGPSAVELLTAASPEAARARLNISLARMQAIKHLALLQVVAHDGTVVVSTDPSLVGTNRLASPYFLSAIAGQARVHEPRYVPDVGKVQVVVSVPIRDGDERVLGVAAGRISLDDIDRLVAADTNYGSLGEFGMLWDEQGIVLSSPAQPAQKLHPLAPLVSPTRNQLVAEARFGPDTQTLLDAAGGAADLVARSRWRLYDPSASPNVTTTIGGVRTQVTSVPVRGTRWTYGVGTPEQNALAAVRLESRRNLAVALTTSLLAILVSFAAARWVTRPLSAVGTAARALAAGDMTRRAHLQRRDELGELADTFDTMADAIARKDGELRQYAEGLERRVEERTAEITGLLHAVPDLIFKVSADGRLVDYVAAKDQELYLPPEQFLGRPITDVLPREVSSDLVDRIRRALAGETVGPYEYRLVLSGTERHYEARLSPSGQGAVVVLVRDITERRRNEERTRFLARAAASLSSSLDYASTVETLAALPVPFIADLCVVDLLERGELRCAAVAATTPDRRALALATRAKFPAVPGSNHPVAVAIRGGITLYSECTPKAFGGFITSEEHLAMAEAIGIRSMMAVPLVARGQTLGAMTFASADSARRYTQADVALASELADRAGIALDNARLYRELQESNRLKDEFLGTVSHELRTPLNAVLGWAQLLKRAADDPATATRAIDAIERNAQAQAQLVEDLLDTSRVVSGKMHVQFVPSDVGDIVRTSIESFRPMARARGIALELAVAPDLAPVLADAARLQQVIGNVVSNALKFTAAGGHVSVTVTRTGATLEIQVSDTGAGISPEFLPYVFDRFRQGDSTTTRLHGGLGLGLSIARHLVELHGGTIRAASDGEQKGSTFTIVLPVAVAAAVAAVQPQRADAAPALTGVRVLAVDDQEDARLLLQAMLTAAGAEVDVAASASEARRMLAARRPDVVISDIGMPGEDGYALIRDIRHGDGGGDQSRLPCIAVTAYAREDDRMRALTAGYDRHITKPLDPAALLRAIADLTGVSST